MPEFMKKCVICESEFKTEAGNRKVCSEECAKVRARKTASRHYQDNREQKQEYGRKRRELSAKRAPLPPRDCVICDRTFEPNTAAQITCGEPCREKRRRIKKRQHDAANRQKRLAYYRDYMKGYRKMIRDDKAKEKADVAARHDRLVERRGMVKAAATIVDRADSITATRRILAAADIHTSDDLTKLGCGEFEFERLSLLKEFSK